MADDEQDTTDKPTMRVVLKREQALIVPENVRDEVMAEVLALLYGKRPPKTARATGWFVVGEFEGASQSKAIRAYTGEPGRPDTKAGDFKAVALKSWKGGERMVAPPQPLFRAEPLED